MFVLLNSIKANYPLALILLDSWEFLTKEEEESGIDGPNLAIDVLEEP